MEKDKKTITKHNDFILKSRYQLSMSEIKIISLLMAEIKKEDKELEIHTFDYDYFVQNVGYHEKKLDYVKNVLRNFKQRQFEIDYIDEDGDVVWELYGFLDYAKVTKDKQVQLKFNDKLKEYLVGLKNNFTIFELNQILKFKSSYSFRLYEMIKVKYEQYKTYKNSDNLLLRIDVDDFKKILGIPDKYPLYANFKQKVLKVATEELQEKSEIYVEYKEIKDGHKVVSLEFFPMVSEEKLEKDNYWKFIKQLREKCVNIEIINDTKNDRIYSINPSGRLYDQRHPDFKIKKDSAFKLFQWFYDNQQHLSTTCKTKMGIAINEIPEFFK